MSTIDPGMEALMEAFIYESTTLLEQLDEIMLESEKEKNISEDSINEIFRIMHTIKGSAAMMGFTGISSLAHSVEDMFFLIREDPTRLHAVSEVIFDLVFQASDFFKQEIESIQGDGFEDTVPTELIAKMKEQAAIMKGEAPAVEASSSAEAPTEAPTAAVNNSGHKQIHVIFDDGCQMENLRAFSLLNQIKDYCSLLYSDPENPELNPASSDEIAKNGFTIFCEPAENTTIDDILKVIENSLNIKSYGLLEDEEPAAPAAPPPAEAPKAAAAPAPAKPAPAAAASASSSAAKPSAKQSLLSVNQSKLDHLMDLVGELVTAESMVASNPDLRGLKLDNFTKSFRELRKLTDELQDVVMSIRMVPLNGTFQKMNRIVRDMSKKLGKPVELVTVGGETEVDKTINDAIADPFMHMIRNSMDHAIESPEERRAKGKPEQGTITMSARNVGGEIIVDIIDDGCGLNPAKLLEKARNNGLLTKPESEYTEKEIFHLIMLPGFSTNEAVTEYSGRGVGMDVVRKNVEKVGGTISIDSKKDVGTTFTIKIPLTLAIMDGMEIRVGNSTMTVPITSIKQSFKLYDNSQVLYNSDGSEMMMIRGECYPIIRLHSYFGIDSEVTDLTEGIVLQVESGNNIACIFADELIGEQQVVVKPFPHFLSKYNLKERGLSGCTILGNGSISLILDVRSILNNER
ncbi:MAG: chemotaxis protein CheA [Clostridiales bacterium]|nr:chemotaxis protein CheA [Clostridiales bacterium]